MVFTTFKNVDSKMLSPFHPFVQFPSLPSSLPIALFAVHYTMHKKDYYIVYAQTTHAPVSFACTYMESVIFQF